MREDPDLIELMQGSVCLLMLILFFSASCSSKGVVISINENIYRFKVWPAAMVPLAND